MGVVGAVASKVCNILLPRDVYLGHIRYNKQHIGSTVQRVSRSVTVHQMHKLQEIMSVHRTHCCKQHHLVRELSLR